MTRAETNKQAALQNIKEKIAILQKWSAKEVLSGLPSNEHIPLTVRQFNHWDMSQNSSSIRSQHKPIRCNANDTLRNYPLLKIEVEQVISLLKLNLSAPREKLDKIITLRKKLIDQQDYINTLEKHTAKQQIQITILEEHHQLEIAKQNNVIAELRKIISKADTP